MLNTISTETLCKILLKYPGMPVAIVTPDGSQIRALWEERIYVQTLNVFANNDGDEPGWSGPVILLDCGPSIGMIA